MFHAIYKETIIHGGYLYLDPFVKSPRNGFFSLFMVNSYSFKIRKFVNKKLFVTTSLPYANGSLHLGHMLEQTQADIWVRFMRLTGNEVIFVSGDDAHGSAIMLSAQKEKISAQDWINKIWNLHYTDSKAFNISYDIFHSTRSKENESLVTDIFKTLDDAGFIKKSKIQQAYDAQAKMFLPDRFIKGTCPKCHAKDQYGDNCEKCGANYSPVDLIDSYSVLTQTKPVMKASEHLFFILEKQQPILEDWLAQANLQPAVRNKLSEWFEQGLRDWDISRDAPYFGFLIPGYKDKYFYVWVDAPVGYIAALLKYAKLRGKDLVDQVWREDNDWEIHHFVGKDIMYFHGLFWPAVLQASGYNMPSSLHAHGFLTIDGAKMSKSRGTMVTAQSYLAKLSPEYLRYYYAAKLSDGIQDMDLAWDDFTQRCNADLVGKIINIGSRSSGFIHKFFQGLTADNLDDADLIAQIADARSTIAQAYYKKQFSLAMREIMALADSVNQYIDRQKPWVLAKDETQLPKVQRVCTTALTAFYQLMIYLAPVLPDSAKKTAKFFNKEECVWQDLDIPLLQIRINVFPRILERITRQDCPVGQENTLT